MSFGINKLRRSLTLGMAAAGLSLSLGAASTAAHAEGEVNIYSLRQAFLIEPILEAFTAETGIKVNVLFAKDGLIERLAQEGRNSPADIILTNSFGNTVRLADEGLVQPVDSEVLRERIPAKFRAEDNGWFGLTQRARILYVSKDRVPEGAITTYEELADPKWKGKVCTRSGTHEYNVQLFAAVVSHYGEAKAKEWLEGVKANLARKPQGNDRAQAKAVSEGECDIAVANSYYYFKMLEEEEQKPWAAAVRPTFVTFEGKGTHVNLTGMAMAPHAPNPENAKLLMEFLAGEMAQRLYADVNYEYPVNPAVAPSEALMSIGELKSDDLPLDQVAKNLPAALQIVADTGYNE